MSVGWSIHRLQLLHELQMRGTITAVATALSYSPSTVSHQLTQLEREVGAPLLQPDGRRVRLTAAGETVAAHAARVLSLEEQTRDELDVDNPMPAPVRIAALQTSARALLPRMLDMLVVSHPGLRVEVWVIPPEEGLFEVEARGFDLVIAEQYPGHTREHRPGLDRVSLGRDPIRLAVSPDSPIYSLEDARGAAWTMEPRGTAVRSWCVQQCRGAGFEPDVRYSSADLLAQVRLISSGHAVGLLPEQLLAGDESPVRLIDLPGSPTREIFTAAREASAESKGVIAVREALQHAFHDATAVFEDPHAMPHVE
ncbi:LysR family transcriptional regulator [Microbacterium amylolyticum]|uniref:DNA-binding transcriptional LysR family regulator n=1 Tax=Microbacterium amylolyticum TaxID=936337 RepID=A0ABS4ZGY2_9MICO|nr:LysR family transcriptional regulator [Microbacterium amylolyticum]MBP2436541.1 DNA-binding transcriptional LysR family regulator [Microbacterium amylolyticum]